ncbi:UNVERIFIED_CONTAM: hypothetical protein FKN15_073251 [Acipenser sinensis]
MGNSESQYSVQGCKSRRLVIPGKQKPCSLRVRSVHAKDEQSRSAHSWGHASSYKTRAQARSCLSQHKSSQPYSTRHYDYVTKGSKNSANDKPRDCSPGNNFRFVPESGFFYAGYDVQSSHSTAAECNGHVENEESLSDTVEDKSSPKVLIKTLGKFDGNLRVEFTNSNNNNRLPIYDCDGPVQLLKYSPTLESTPSSSGISRRQSPSPGDSGLRTSKGSSFSSESSWYDAPWGNDAADFNDMEHPNSSSRAADTSLGDAVLQNQQRLFEQRASPISLQDLYRDASIASAFPAEKGLSPESLNAPRSKKRASLAPDVEVVSDSEGLGSMQYSSYTLPCRKSKPVVEGNAKKDTLKSRMMRISDWTGSLTRKKRKLQEPKYKEASECFDSGIDGFTTDTSYPSQVSSLLWPPSAGPTLPLRSESSHALHSDALRQNIYENFMRELETGRCSSETETETSSDSLGSREQLDLLFQKEQGVVRKAGWLFFKPLVTLHKDKKLELAPRRKWKQYWVTLKGCTLLFYETYGKNSMEQDFSPHYALFAEDSIVQSVPEHPKKENVFCLSNTFGDAYFFQGKTHVPFACLGIPSCLACPVTLAACFSRHSGCTLLFYETYGKNSMEQDFSPRYALFAEDSIVQSVPEHPKKENVFCLSNTFGDAYLFQATSQTDLENWVTAIHSASASLFAKKQGKEETVRLLRSQTRGLVQKIDMDSKMRKMGELQLATVRDPKNRKAIENQIQQWEQNLEKFNVDLFRMRCYLASLQGGELPNPKSLLAAASRPSKLALSRLGIFSVSSFHALICSRDEATLRKRSLSHTMRGKKGLFSSLKGLDSLTKRGKEKRASVSQIQQWEQNLEKFNVDLFRMRCYLASLQGGELPNPKSLLAAASRPSKLALSRLGIFSVSSFHVLICSRDEATLRKRSLSHTMRGKKGLFSSLKGLDSLTKRGKEKRASVSQRIDGTANIYSAAPPGGSHWESCYDTSACVYLPDTQGVTVTVHQDLRVEDVLNLVCKKKLLDPSQYCLRLRRTVGGNMELSTPASNEYLQGLIYDELEVFPLNVFHLHLLRTGTTADFGGFPASVMNHKPLSLIAGFAVTGHIDGQRNSRIFVSEVLPDGVAYCEGLRAGDEILSVNEKTVSTLDLGLMEPLFSQQSLMLTLRRDLLGLPSQLPPPNQSELLEEFLDKHPKQASAGKKTNRFK